jgi:hypothetical protein
MPASMLVNDVGQVRLHWLRESLQPRQFRPPHWQQFPPQLSWQTGQRRLLTLVLKLAMLAVMTLAPRGAGKLWPFVPK